MGCLSGSESLLLRSLLQAIPWEQEDAIVDHGLQSISVLEQVSGRIWPVANAWCISLRRHNLRQNLPTNSWCIRLRVAAIQSTSETLDNRIRKSCGVREPGRVNLRTVSSEMGQGDVSLHNGQWSERKHDT